ncbi:MAG: tetratricopeptide repeat protein [Candidatus Omnitrophica bacterium]|nr:tetratricopeptide repeat protein [Candidatus Omnitrophota bacterium]
MRKKLHFVVLLTGIILFTSGSNNPAFAASTPAAVEYLCQSGVDLYNQGKYDEAVYEFRRALILDPGNKIAGKYISDIKEGNAPKEYSRRDMAMDNALSAPAKITSEKKFVVARVISQPQIMLSRDEVMNETLIASQAPEPMPVSPEEIAMEEEYQSEETPRQKKPIDQYIIQEIKDKTGLKVSGKAQAGFGVTSDAFIWKRANFDLNEKYKSWRLSSDAAFNRHFNTYDPRIYDSLDINLDTENKEGLNLHTDITTDPWSFVGKSDKVTVTGANGDTAELQMYYWSNTGYVLNNTVYTSRRGDTFGIPELKVRSGETDAFTATSYRYKTTFNVPAMKITRQFQPFRELWLDYNVDDQLKLRAFPIGYQDQAYSSDDPLGITNHRIWWQDSMWLRRYTPGIYNSADTTRSYTKGRWDDTLSFITKDSTGKYLTALRGAAFSIQPQEQTSFDTTIATPKDLWQDYAQVDNISAASRLKHKVADNFAVGGTFTSRSGFITDPSQKLDSQNLVYGMDLGYEISKGLKVQAEILSSRSFYDVNNSEYETDSQGNAYYFSFISRYPKESIMDLKYGYDEIAMSKEEDILAKSKFYAVRMDKGFDSSLSNFHNSRQDVFWSRHIHFRKPFAYYDGSMQGPTTKWDELNATRIGDGIDAGRSVLGFRFEFLLRDKFSNLFDVRNVHDTRGKFVENVARDEATIALTDKLTAKAFGLYQRMPRTQGGIDPFVYDGNTGEFFLNSTVKDDMNASLKTGSLGLSYDFFDWLSINGIYERTNDYTLAYGDFPRNTLRNDTSLYGSYYQNNKLYRYITPFLNDQQYFPQAPYSFFNVFKCGLKLAPLNNMEVYLDYTRNEFEAASYNSDNMNHIGLEIGYMPTPKLGMALKYVYSRCQDIDRLGTGQNLVVGHNNFFAEFRYLPTKDDEFTLQYGEGNTSSIGNMVLDPYGGSMLTLDTQHIARLYYRRKF